MLHPSSRYEVITAYDGTAISKVKPRKPSAYELVVFKEGQSFEELAATHLGDANLWWRIADINPQVLWPDEIASGTRIRIPRG